MAASLALLAGLAAASLASQTPERHHQPRERTERVKPPAKERTEQFRLEAVAQPAEAPREALPKLVLPPQADEFEMPAVDLWEGNARLKMGVGKVKFGLEF